MQSLRYFFDFLALGDRLEHLELFRREALQATPATDARRAVIRVMLKAIPQRGREVQLATVNPAKRIEDDVQGLRFEDATGIQMYGVLDEPVGHVAREYGHLGFSNPDSQALAERQHPLHCAFDVNDHQVWLLDPDDLFTFGKVARGIDDAQIHSGAGAACESARPA